MAEKILYYLGAGASARALPIAADVIRDGKVVVPGLPRGLEAAQESFKQIANQMDPARMDFLWKCFSDFKNLAGMGRKFGNVDTHAKYLYLQGEAEALANVKKTLAAYFGIMQLWRNTTDDEGAIDNRYLPWLISILEEKEFPDNIKILSWNYDFQIQLAAQNFWSEQLENEGKLLSFSLPLIHYFPNIGDYDVSLSSRRLSLVHLNGIAGLFETGNGDELKHFYLPEYLSNPDAFVNAAKEKDLSFGIHFAWEKGSYHRTLLGKVDEMIADTSIVVVIGYSFPFFNREVDKAIFKKLKSMKSFRKIYYQDPVLNGQQLRAQFDLGPTLEIEHISQVENFHIPFEY